MCFCKTCGHFFGPDFQCDDPPERKKINCFLCTIELQSSDLKNHMCFHLGRKADPKEDSDRIGYRVTRSETYKSKTAERKKITEINLYAKARSKYSKARKKYFEEVRKLKEGRYDKKGTAESDIGGETSSIIEPEVLLCEASDEETDLCMFCSEEVPLQFLSKHENQHRLKEQLLTLQQKRKLTTKPDKDEVTICHICGQFVNRKNFRSHKQFHTRRKKAVICEICGFSSKNITQHRISHSNQRKYNCEKCDMSFKTAHTLQKHDLVHTDVGQHRCPTCEKAFKAPYNLTVHMRSHMVKKPFECDFCDKTFTTKQWRDNHLKSHK